MIRRNIMGSIETAMTDTPVVLLHGARQTGKSTLVKYLIKDKTNAEYVTLDDTATLSSAVNDPAGFIDNSKRIFVIDEVQKAPQIFSTIKLFADKNRKPGKFILTGSANNLLIPRLSDHLVGRMEIITMYPFSKGEMNGEKEAFIDQVFSEKQIEKFTASDNKTDILKSIVSGGFPEIMKRRNPERKREWFQSYINTILQRDIKEISNIEGLVEFPRLLSLLASRTGTLFNLAELSRSISIAQSTLKRYISYLTGVYVIKLIPAYSAHLSKRLTKAPKIIFTDTGIASYLDSIYDTQSLKAGNMKGRLLENFVFMELIKQKSWSRANPEIYHYRTSKGSEVDIILESRNKMVGIEVKFTATPGINDFKGLKHIAEDFKGKFHRGILLYTGQNTLSFGKNLFAMPVESLWNSGAVKN